MNAILPKTNPSLVEAPDPDDTPEAELTMRTLHPGTSWKAGLAVCQDFAMRVSARAKRIAESRREQAWRLAETVGLPRDLCCIHNASIDDEFRGWCAGPEGKERNEVAKRVCWMLDDWQWEPSRIADKIIAEAYRRLMENCR